METTIKSLINDRVALNDYVEIRTELGEFTGKVVEMQTDFIAVRFADLSDEDKAVFYTSYIDLDDIITFTVKEIMPC